MILSPHAESETRSRRWARSRWGHALLAAVAALLAVLAMDATPAGASSPAVSYTYDAAGRLASVTNASGQTATYHYDPEGNVLSITRSTGAGRAQAAARPRTSPPRITTAIPSVVTAGGKMTVYGSGFSADRWADVVRIGGLYARVRRAAPERLEVSAPPGGGGALTVTTERGSARGPVIRVLGTGSPPADRPGVNRRPLLAPEGVTALSGLVERADGQPLPGVRLTVTGASGGIEATVKSDASGRFLIAHLSPGQHQLVIDGDHVEGSVRYGLYAEPVELPAAKTTVLPWITYLTALDLAHAISIRSPTRRALTLTSPRLPGLEVQIPKGTVIRDYYGRVVRRVSLTPLPVGRTPFPWAPGMVPQYFSLQPGDARVTGPGLRVIYPNHTGQPPGTAIPYFIESPDWAGSGWWRYGTGHVSASGRQVLPDAGTAYRTLLVGGYAAAPPPPPDGPPCDCGADPVNLPTGLFVHQETDLSLPDVEPVTLTRTFRQLDDTVRDFGIGMSDSLSLYISLAANGDFDLILPDGSQVAYAPSGTTGIYDAVGTPSELAGSTLDWGNSDPDGPFAIRTTDGTTLSFGNPAYLTMVTDRFGNSITITRKEGLPYQSGGGELETVTTPGGRWLKFTYGVCVPGSYPSDCVTQVQDNAGRTLSYAYDKSGRLIQVTGPAGGVTKYTWASCTTAATCTELLTVTDSDGHTTVSNTYDPSSGRVTSQTNGDGGTWNYDYITNAQGQVTQTNVTDPRDVTDAFTFDAAGYPTAETTSVGTSVAETTQFAYNASTNLLASQTDPLGRTTSYTYDALGNLEAVTFLAGTAKPSKYSFTYEPVYNRIASITDPLGHTTTFSYHDLSGTETETDPLGHTWTATLNREGQPTEITDPLGRTAYLSYIHSDLVAVADPLGRVTSTYYDSVGRPLAISDPEGNITQYKWTPLDEPAASTDPLGHTSSYIYDPDGQLTALTDANKHTTTYAYDVMGDLVKQADPLGNTDTYSYDKLGNLTSHTDRNGSVTAYSYDDQDRLVSVKFGVSGDTAQSSIGYSYDLANRLVKAIDSVAGTYQYTYDGLDDTLSAVSPQGTIAYTYDAASRRTSMSAPDQATVNYTYDAADELTRIAQGTSTVSMGYDPDGDETSLTLPDGILRSAKYDVAGDPTTLAFTHASTQLGTLNYAYSQDGQISSVSGSMATTSLPAALTSASYNADNELLSWNGTSDGYDKDGNLLSVGTNQYTWNARGELVSIAGGTAASFVYDPFGRRASSTIGAHATTYLYDNSTSSRSCPVVRPRRTCSQAARTRYSSSTRPARAARSSPMHAAQRSRSATPRPSSQRHTPTIPTGPLRRPGPRPQTRSSSPARRTTAPACMRWAPATTRRRPGRSPVKIRLGSMAEQPTSTLTRAMTRSTT